MKICTLCKIEKPFDCFSFKTKVRNSLHAWCKPCLHLKKMEWRSRCPRPSRAKMGPPAPRSKKPPKIVSDEILAERKRKDAAFKKEWYARNSEELKRKRREKRRILIELKPLIMLESAFRSRISQAFKAKGVTKKSKTFEMIGCTKEHLIRHIEAQFSSGMSWDNRGYRGWHVDHKIPLSSANTAEELTALCHYTNLQPLWAEDNMRKGAKMPDNAEDRPWPIPFLSS